MVTRIDVINDWAHYEQYDQFTYQNGSSIGYTYGIERSGLANSYTNHYGGLGSQNLGDIVTITFDQPAHGISFEFGHFDSSEVGQFTIDGVVVELDEWLADGRITITGPDVVGDGSNLLDADGDIVSGASSTGNFINFQVPVTSLEFERTDTNPSPGSFYDLYIDAEAAQPPCFTAGTLITTDKGPIKVEDLQIGDLVKTMDHGFQPVRWVGCSPTYAHGNKAPVRIKAGTFGNTRDLVVSPRHRMLLKGWQMDLLFNHEQALACAGDMVNDSTITREPNGMVDYYHILFDRHEIIFAEGAATESFHPDSDIDAFGKSTRDELLELFPELATQGYGAPVRHTINTLQAFYVKHNLEMLD